MRLIDADALKKSITDWYCDPKRCNNYYGVKCRACPLDDALSALDDAPTVGGWISVKDRLPEEKENPYTKDYQEVLCVLKTRFGTDVRVYKFGKGHFWNGSQEIDRMISHWTPFPELPQEESDD